MHAYLNKQSPPARVNKLTKLQTVTTDSIAGKAERVSYSSDFINNKQIQRPSSIHHSESSKHNLFPTSFSYNYARSISKGKAPVPLQPKLTINQPNDEYEQEADAAADKIMHADTVSVRKSFLSKTPQPYARRTCTHCEEAKLKSEEHEHEEEPAESGAGTGIAIQKKCAACDDEEKKKDLYRKESGDPSSPKVFSAVEQTLASAGQELDIDTRSFMEQKFSYDFRNVRVHNDALAHQSSRDIQAKAYTYQNHIAFGNGQYQPGTDEGKKLLAHELTHVVQQGYEFQESSIHRAPENACGRDFLFSFEAVANSEKEKDHRGVPRLFYNQPTGLNENIAQYFSNTPLKLVPGTVFGAGQTTKNKLWRAVCYAPAPDAPSMIYWVLNEYVSRKEKAPAKTEEKKKLATNEAEGQIKDPVGLLNLAKLRLKDLLDRNMFRKEMAGLFDALLSQINKDIADLAGTSAISGHDKENYVDKANALYISLRDDGAVLTHLLQLDKKELYIENIAEMAQAVIKKVRQQFEQAIAHAYVDTEEAVKFHNEGTKLLYNIPHDLSGLYLEKGKGLNTIVSQIGDLELQIETYRSKSGKGLRTRKIDDYLKDNINPEKTLNRLIIGLQAELFRNAPGVLTRIYQLYTDSQRYLGVYSIIALFEQFDFFDKKIPWSTSSSDTRAKVRGIRNKLDSQINNIEPTLAPALNSGSGQKDFEAAMESAMAEFRTIVQDNDFKLLLKSIESSFEDWEIITLIGKTIVIVGVAAIAAGYAGVAIGNAMELAGAGSAVALGAVSFAEALAFTTTSRAVSTALQVPSTETFGKELVVNLIMFGYMKKFEQWYKAITVVMESKGMVKGVALASNVLVKGGASLAALQLFALGHQAVKSGKPMTADEFVKSTVFNAIVMSVLHLGKFMLSPLNAKAEADIRKYIIEKFSNQFEKLEADRGELKTLIEKLNAEDPAGSESVIEALVKVKEVSTAELDLLSKAYKALGKTQVEMQAVADKYKKVIEEADLLLTKRGMQGKSGTEIFAEVKPGTILFEDAQADTVKDILEAFYKQVGGSVTVKDGIFMGILGAETTFFMPESKAVEQHIVNLFEQRRDASQLQAKIKSSTIPELERPKSLDKLTFRALELKKRYEVIETLIHEKKFQEAIEQLHEFSKDAAKVQAIEAKLANASLIGSSTTGGSTYRWSGTTKLQEGLEALGAYVTKVPDPSTGLRTTTAKFPDGTILTFVERRSPYILASKEVIVDASKPEVQKLFADYSITDPAAQREVLRRLEVALSKSNENYKSSIGAVKTVFKEMLADPTQGTIEHQLLQIVKKGSIAAGIKNPDLLLKADALEKMGILRSYQWLSARTPQEFLGTVTEYLALEEITSTSASAGKTVFKKVQFYGDMFDDAAGSIPHVRSKGGGSTDIEVVPEIDAVAGNVNGSNFDLTDLFNVKGGKGATDAANQNAIAEIAFKAFSGGTIGGPIATRDGKTIYFKVKRITAVDEAGKATDLTGSVTVPSKITSVTYGAAGHEGFDKNLKVSTADSNKIADILREKQLMQGPNY